MGSERGALLTAARRVGVDPDEYLRRVARGERWCTRCLVQRGELPAPNSLECEDCGHIHFTDERRHEYDHYLGYAAEHHEDLEVVCTTCHAEREKERRRDGYDNN